MATASDEIPTIFDADNHYWETSDAFTRHRDPKFADRGVTARRRRRQAALHVRRRAAPSDHPGPGDVHLRPRPGRALRLLRRQERQGPRRQRARVRGPSEHPEWFDRDARLRCMDEQGVEAAWLFPSQGVCMEGPMQPDIEASIHILRAFNRWLDDDWGFAYQNRIFAVPFLTLSDVDQAVDELEWCLEHGARVVSIRNGPVFTPEGTRVAGRSDVRPVLGARRRSAASSSRRTPASRTATRRSARRSPRSGVDRPAWQRRLPSSSTRPSSRCS